MKTPVRIAMVGKYTSKSYSYLFVLKALLHVLVALDRKLVVDWVPSCDGEDTAAKEGIKEGWYDGAASPLPCSSSVAELQQLEPGCLEGVLVCLLSATAPCYTCYCIQLLQTLTAVSYFK